MFFRGYTLRYAAVIFLSALFLLLSGLMVYSLWFSPPREAPRRSRPVTAWTGAAVPGPVQAGAEKGNGK